MAEALPVIYLARHGETACLCMLSYEHNLAEPAIRLWNDTHHLERPSAMAKLTISQQQLRPSKCEFFR